MKFKYYLRGCGLGILFASIILMIAFHTHGSRMDDADVMERASELGMITPETQSADTEENTQQSEPATQEDTQKVTEPDPSTDKSDGNTKKNTDTKNDQVKSSEADTQKTDSDKKNSDKKSTDKTDSDKTDSDKKNSDDKKQDSTEEEEISVEIKRGEVCRDLAEELQKLGLVDDAETFRKYMQRRGYDNQIRVGTFTLKRGMTQEEIAKVFVTK